MTIFVDARPRGLPLLKRAALVAIAALSLAGCGLGDRWFGPGEDPPLPGERVSVMQLDRSLQPDPEAGSAITIPPAQQNDAWPQSGLGATHQTGNLSASYPFERAWRSSIGAGSTRNRRVISPPIVADGRVFAVDSQGRVTALDAGDGRRVWSVRAASPDEDTAPLGGGVAYADGVLYATTAFGEIMALDPANGGLVWRTQTSGPVRAAPAVAGGRVYAVTVDNRMEVLDAETGAVIWRHQGLQEPASILRSASPAVASGVVVVPYSSGELYALRVESGAVAWADSLATVARVGGGANALADISASPVVDESLVVAISNSGRVVGIDLRSGIRAWEQPIGGTSMPVVAGNTVFMVSNNGEVVALSRVNGAIRWVTQLPRFRNEEDRSGPIIWTGPVMADGRLVLVSSYRKGIVLDAATGEVEAQFDLPDSALVTPAVANGTLYVLTDDGSIVAYR